MTLILPMIFTGVFWAFWGFVLGDWYWVQHAMSWTGYGIARALLAIMYVLGLFMSFAGGAVIDCGE